ncbi:hypothetical protein FNF31_03150 [Cafeteria roenbergensis]|uniref:NADH dehydrogenase [ubiquinone] 1 alpha subcomplex subunit 5 n=1 Tax=Cafeteria roenbergensis TaxID=33653 RepID=A0A5A8DAN2_CAFRO|nr:hypothetical protein FNF31_03150 [Cafeteria roenbergensis]KAA0170729.1 hypothetical protein FNF28_01270 [Cafeteria roenbergensis]
MAFRATRAVMAYTKKTTGIVGLPVEPNARAILIDLYSTFLEKVKIIPEEAGFRRIMTNLNAYRLKTVQDNEDIAAIEDLNEGFQVEELIEMAKNDIECVSVYFKYRMWETSDFDDFEMDNDLEKVFGDSVKWFDKDMEPEAFNHALHHVNDHLRAEARGEVPSEEALTAHQERYLHVFRLGMFGEEKTVAMAKEDAKIVAERTAREAEKAAAAERA